MENFSLTDETSLFYGVNVREGPCFVFLNLGDRNTVFVGNNSFSGIKGGDGGFFAFLAGLRGFLKVGFFGGLFVFFFFFLRGNFYQNNHICVGVWLMEFIFFS